MKRLLLSLCLMASLAFGAPKTATPAPALLPLPLPVKEQTISNDDLKKTLEHIIDLAKQEQGELDATKTENDNIKKQNLVIQDENVQTKQALLTATNAHQEALQRADQLQKQVTDLTNDRNNQAKLKDAALDKVDVLTKENTALKTHVNHLKVIICLEAVVLAIFLVLRLRLLSLLPPYLYWIVLIGGPAAVFGLVWLLI